MVTKKVETSKRRIVMVLSYANIFCTGDMNLDQVLEAAVGYSVGITEDINEGERYTVSHSSFV